MNLINGNCLEEMKKIPDNSIDLIVTDPPYNIGQDNKRTKVGNKICTNKEAWGKWDNYGKEEYDIFIKSVLIECFRILKEGGGIYMFTAREDNGFFIREATKIGFKYLNQLAIIKKNPLPHFAKTNYRSAFELCFYMSKGKVKTFNFISQQECVNTFSYAIGRKFSKHPTEKPLDFIKRIVNISSKEGDIVLDPFMGSGTTGVACKNLNRDFIGIELDETYFKMAEERLK